MKRVGVIGLGSIGQWIARNLAKAGYPLSICDVNKEAVEKVKKATTQNNASVRNMGQILLERELECEGGIHPIVAQFPQ